MKKIQNKISLFFKKYWLFIAIFLILLITIIILLLIYNFKPYKVDKDFSKINLENVDKLMIVAHPDDELLWGGAHLIEDDYLVVCITCGVVKERVNEFVNVMNATNDKYIMLAYPDKTNGERDNWDEHRENIKKDLQDILNLKDWELIVTHNPDGEYGHAHHKMTSSITTKIVSDKSKLYYFGRYHSKKNIPNFYNSMTPINDKFIKTKKDIIGLYKSQSFIQTSFDHMFAYEDWENYSEWEDELNEKL